MIPGSTEQLLCHLRAERDRYRRALEEIRDDPHQSYAMHELQSAGEGQYRIGVADGHRCAASKARSALESYNNDRQP